MVPSRCSFTLILILLTPVSNFDFLQLPNCSFILFLISGFPPVCQLSLLPLSKLWLLFISIYGVSLGSKALSSSRLPTLTFSSNQTVASSYLYCWASTQFQTLGFVSFSSSCFSLLPNFRLLPFQNSCFCRFQNSCIYPFQNYWFFLFSNCGCFPFPISCFFHFKIHASFCSFSFLNSCFSPFPNSRFFPFPTSQRIAGV